MAGGNQNKRDGFSVMHQIHKDVMDFLFETVTEADIRSSNLDK